jgi:trans-aconitate 2-methyltransferase
VTSAAATLAWSPGVYARHATPRLRPALDLLARVPLERAASVVDLGCGAGALFPALRARFPGARLTGVDLSPEMLAAAADPAVELVAADAATWRPDAPVDLIVANASLHWVPDHGRLVPDLLGRCRVLAVQVPDNFEAPAHRMIRELMAKPPWDGRLSGVGMGDHVLPAEAYLALLGSAGAAVDLWRTTYYQRLDGPDAVLAWVRGTTLLPVQAALGGAASPASRAFEAALGERLRAAYPPDAAGATLFPFRRLFFVAAAPA